MQVDGVTINSDDIDSQEQPEINLIDKFVSTPQNFDWSNWDPDQKKQLPYQGIKMLGHKKILDTNVMGGAKPAILLTGATHARELISTSLTLF